MLGHVAVVIGSMSGRIIMPILDSRAVGAWSSPVVAYAPAAKRAKAVCAAIPAPHLARTMRVRGIATPCPKAVLLALFSLAVRKITLAAAGPQGRGGYL